jgi:DNA helicase-2/ATP-dependent DNA helicase PcrA
LHAAKGLEFETVFLAGWEEGLFPHPRALNEVGGNGIEEERRLAYVGLSRARTRAIISYAYQRRQPQGWQSAQPSRFIREIPSDVVIHQNPSGGDVRDMHMHEVTATMVRDTYARQSSGGNRSSAWASGGGSAHLYNPASEKALMPRVSRPESVVANHSFKTGDRVFHEKFGQGNVLAFEGDKLLIQFEAHGLKKIIASFVSRA